MSLARCFTHFRVSAFMEEPSSSAASAHNTSLVLTSGDSWVPSEGKNERGGSHCDTSFRWGAASCHHHSRVWQEAPTLADGRSRALDNMPCSRCNCDFSSSDGFPDHFLALRFGPIRSDPKNVRLLEPSNCPIGKRMRRGAQ